MQKAIIVRGTDVSELNRALNEDYKVVNMCDMTSHVATSITGQYGNTRDKESTPQCLVIIER